MTKYQLDIKMHPVRVGVLPCITVVGGELDFYFPIELIAQHLLGPYEQLEGNAIQTTFDANDRVIEGGAGIGVNTVRIARLASFVVAYEPIASYAKVARTNVDLNGANAEIRTVALALKDGQVEYSIRSIVSASSALPDRLYPEPTAVRLVVECANIDTEVKRYNINALHLDVEGTEHELLMNMDLTPIDKITMEVHPTVLGIDRVEEMIQHLIGEGFERAAIAGEIFYPKSNYIVSYARPQFIDEIRARCQSKLEQRE